MGWLHEGHRSLMQRARADSATTVVTIFVNPRQFNEASDYTRYPRNEARDLAICNDEGVDIIFAPPVEEVYPPGFDTVVSVGAISRPLEGAARPGHFDGVATVVAILFSLVGAERAYFGQKDAQQVMVIRRMAIDLALPTEVVTCPTVREPDGLALSSRNARLTPEERSAAAVLHRALLAGRAAWEAGDRSGASIRAAVSAELAREPLARLEYVSVADPATLAELERVDRPAILSLAVRFGDTRLIDNEPLPGPS
jgi:pantoate--beta-alanine ligase